MSPSNTTPAPKPSQKSGDRKNDARVRARVRREQQRKAERRRKFLMSGGVVAAVIAVVVALVVVKIATGSGNAKSGEASGLASAAVVQGVTNVSPAVLDTVGVGTSSSPPTAVAATPLTAGGKPEILYVGAEYCPFCATERWAMVAALSRFGTFTNLGATTSSPSDVDPSTATLSFHGASYTSQYLSFVGKEIQSNQVSGNSYAPLDTLSTSEQALFTKYDSPPYVPSNSEGGIPFVDLGGKYFIHAAGYDPSVLQGKTREQIAADLSNPTTAIAKGVDGAANVITAAICTLTNNAPANVCTSSGVKAGAPALKSK
jgi:hypothetical protein